VDVSREAVLKALERVIDPELRRSVVELDMVRRIDVADGRVGVTIALTVAGCPLRASFQEQVDRALASVEGVEAVDLSFDVMTAEEKTALTTKLRGGVSERTPGISVDATTRVIGIVSGKGGVGKSTLAAMLAARLGVNRLIATDVIRQVLRAVFTPEAMPTVHGSAFEMGGVAGYRDQAERVGTGIAAIVERAAAEAKPVVVEGVHVVPGGVHPRVRERCVLVEALVVVDDAELHRGHFSLRPGTRPAERYLSHFEEIRRLQDHLWNRARSEQVAIVDNTNVDDALARLMELVLDAVSEDR
jgi:metal-sulfur cluster biosynthetic enzyme/predicted kinase